MNGNSHVLMIPSWYPSEDQPIFGSFFKEYAEALRSAGTRIGIVYPDIRQLRTLSPRLFLKNHFQISSVIEDGMPIIRRHGWNLFPKMMKRQMLSWKKQAEKLAAIYVDRYGKPDLIQAQSCVWGGIAAQTIAETMDIPYCITEHRDVFLDKRILNHPHTECWSTPYIREAFDNAAAIIAVSASLRVALTSFTKKTLDEIHRIPNAVDADLFFPRNHRPECKPFTFLSIGSLDSRKNNAMLLKALKLLVSSGCRLRLEIGGDGPERDLLENLAATLGIREHVSFLGQLTRQGVGNAFREADVFVLPSQNESFGVVCIEALASGIPVVATRCGGPEDIVDDTTGCLVALNDVHALAKGMLHIKQNIGCYIPADLHKNAIEKYGKDVVVRQYQQLYNQITYGVAELAL